MLDEIVLRPPTDGDLRAITHVVDAQDVAWWGEPDGDMDDTRDELCRVIRATGSLAAGARLAIVDGEVVGVGLLVGHGHTTLAVDPSTPRAGAVLLALVEWLSSNGGAQFDAPSQDGERLAQLASLGFIPTRSSFELERPSDVADLPDPAWPNGVVPVTFRLGVDDEELHSMIYSFWTDVPGHTHRPLDEWRALMLAGASFDPELVIAVRADDGGGPLVACASGRTFNTKIGWVSQLGVAREMRGRGLGRAVLLEACHRLARADSVELIGLGVEAENTNALGLYRSVGMEVAREYVHCSRR
jgi:mycothiol synthase